MYVILVESKMKPDTPHRYAGKTLQTSFDALNLQDQNDAAGLFWSQTRKVLTGASAIESVTMRIEFDPSRRVTGTCEECKS